MLGKLLLYTLPDGWKLTRWCVAVDLIIIWFLCKWLVFQPPAPGYAIGLLGFLAIVISIKTPPSKFERVIWLALSTLLIIVEFHSITLDRQVNQDEQTILRAQERQSFLLVTNQESRHFQKMLDDARRILSGERDLQRTDYQRFFETYVVAGKLLKLANDVSLEDPDRSDGIWGHYKFRWIGLKKAGDDAKAKEVLAQFAAVKKRTWDGWQDKVDRYIPEARAHESELRKRLPDNEPSPKQNVAAFLKTGKLVRKRAIDAQNLRDTAEYLRELAGDLAASPAKLAAQN